MTAYDALMEQRDSDPGAMLADKGYDSDAIRHDLQDRGAAPEIPTKSNRKVQHSVSKRLYRLRSRIECFIGHLKEQRRIATRYDKTATSFLGFVLLGCDKTKVAQGSRQVWSANVNLPNALSLQPAHRRLEVALDKVALGPTNVSERDTTHFGWLATPSRIRVPPRPTRDGRRPNSASPRTGSDRPRCPPGCALLDEMTKSAGLGATPCDRHSRPKTGSFPDELRHAYKSPPQVLENSFSRRYADMRLDTICAPLWRCGR